MSCINWSALTVLLLALPCAWAVEGPFFITYTHQMEEPGNLEIATKTATAQPAGGYRFLGVATEFEYGVQAWWTSEWYFDGQSTSASKCPNRAFSSRRRSFSCSVESNDNLAELFTVIWCLPGLPLHHGNSFGNTAPSSYDMPTCPGGARL